MVQCHWQNHPSGGPISLANDNRVRLGAESHHNLVSALRKRAGSRCTPRGCRKLPSPLSLTQHTGEDLRDRRPRSTRMCSWLCPGVAEGSGHQRERSLSDGARGQCAHFSLVRAVGPGVRRWDVTHAAEGAVRVGSRSADRNLLFGDASPVLLLASTCSPGWQPWDATQNARPKLKAVPQGKTRT